MFYSAKVGLLQRFGFAWMGNGRAPASLPSAEEGFFSGPRLGLLDFEAREAPVAPPPKRYCKFV